LTFALPEALFTLSYGLLSHLPAHGLHAVSNNRANVRYPLIRREVDPTMLVNPASLDAQQRKAFQAGLVDEMEPGLAATQPLIRKLPSAPNRVRAGWAELINPGMEGKVITPNCGSLASTAGSTTPSITVRPLTLAPRRRMKNGRRLTCR